MDIKEKLDILSKLISFPSVN